MLAGIARSVPGGSAAVVTGLAIVFLGALAFAVPPPPIEVSRQDAERGMLVGHSRFSDALAEQLAGNGYTYLAIDLTNARLEGDALWRKHFKGLSRRQFPIWGWVDVRASAERALALAQTLPLRGMFLYGPGAADAAASLRAQQPGLSVVPVVRSRDPRPEGTYGVTLDAAAFAANAGSVPVAVLLANRMSAGEVRAARQAATGSYLVASVSIPD